MRVERNGISVRAVVGTRNVLLAMDGTETARDGLLGFALGSRRPGQRSTRWMRGFKFFEEIVPDPQPGEVRSTLEHPIQSFLWGDYSAIPGQRVTYVVRPLYGTPSDLRPGEDIEIVVTTASETTGDHVLFFNRGAIPSQAFARKFGNVGPSEDEQNDPNNEKVQWLSRGLLEGLLDFISKATGPNCELRLAVYEFEYPPVLAALRIAAEGGTRVMICYAGGDYRRDGTVQSTPRSEANESAIEDAGLRNNSNIILIPRTRWSGIPHNKFFLLLRDGEPSTVWTGSTNITASGFLGQSNVGHIICRSDTAHVFNKYWEKLASDPSTGNLKTFNIDLTPTPAIGLPVDGVTTIFSPRKPGMMEWYADRVASAQSSVMLTAAFGVDDKIAAKFAEDRDFLRFVLMEKRDRNLDEQAMLERDRDTLIALGFGLNTDTIKLELDGFRLDEWFRAEEHFRKKNEGYVFYVHTKYMLLDALTDDPIIFTGSANFSDPSVEKNDENMLLVRGDDARAIAPIFVSEFNRLFNHLYFRTIAVQNARRRRPGQTDRPISHLTPDDRWTDRHFQAGSFHDKRRKMFR